eukprot:1386845-Rhodomonas_salina.2
MAFALPHGCLLVFWDAIALNSGDNRNSSTSDTTFAGSSEAKSSCFAAKKFTGVEMIMERVPVSLLNVSTRAFCCAGESQACSIAMQRAKAWLARCFCAVEKAGSLELAVAIVGCQKVVWCDSDLGDKKCSSLPHVCLGSHSTWKLLSILPHAVQTSLRGFSSPHPIDVVPYQL